MKVIGFGCAGIVLVLLFAVVAGALVYSGYTDDDSDENEIAATDATATAEAEEGDEAAGEADSENPTAEPEPTESPSPTATQEPTPTPSPEPTPTPEALADVPRSECYQERPAEGEHDLTLLPAESRSLFQQCQIIAYYGFPGEPNMGIAGEYEPEEMIRRLKEQTAAYEEFNGFRTAVPALELIYAVAQGYETADGTYLARMSDDLVREWIDIAEQHDLLLIFDIQIGSSSVEAEVQHLLPYLENPRVHLALDPEFVTTPGNPPGQAIGTLDASAINQAQQMVKEVVDQHDLPNKIVMVHQFIPEMISNKEQIEDVEGIDLVIHQDGFGAPEDKIANYDRFVGAENAKHGGFKVFYKQDEPVLTPQQLMDLTPQPDVISYQ